MSDLVKRLRDCEFMGLPDGRLDYSTATEAAARIEALEARIAKADALADACEELIASMGAESGEIDRKLASKDARMALAAYREGSDT